MNFSRCGARVRSCTPGDDRQPTCALPARIYYENPKLVVGHPSGKTRSCSAAAISGPKEQWTLPKRIWRTEKHFAGACRDHGRTGATVVELQPTCPISCVNQLYLMFRYMQTSFITAKAPVLMRGEEIPRGGESPPAPLLRDRDNGLFLHIRHNKAPRR
jgi:hypothetical protein